MCLSSTPIDLALYSLNSVFISWYCLHLNQIHVYYFCISLNYMYFIDSTLLFILDLYLQLRVHVSFIEYRKQIIFTIMHSCVFSYYSRIFVRHLNNSFFFDDTVLQYSQKFLLIDCEVIIFQDCWWLSLIFFQY